MPNPEKRKVVLEYLLKYRTLPSRTIAKALFERERQYFPTLDAARSCVRIYRGQQGEKMREQTREENIVERIVIPKSESVPYVQYDLTDFPIMVGSDVHLPYHSEEALDMFLNYACKIGAKTILFNGDFFDFYELSRFCKDARKRKFAEEIDMGRELLHQISKSFKVVFKTGNHEDRYRKYLESNAPALLGLPCTELGDILQAQEYGIDMVDMKRIIKAKKLYILHGHEYVGGTVSPVNPARGIYLKAKKSTLCGHFHQASEHTESAIDGRIVTCWSVGCLCGLNPEYMPLNKWSNGFAEIQEDGDSFMVRNYRIFNGKIL